MALYSGSLPDFREELKGCLTLLQKDLASGPLPAEDHAFLQETYAHLWSRLEKASYEERPLHGDCHLGNVIKTAQGYLWTDFETACRGPLEWDLSALPEGFPTSYPINQELCRLLRNFRSWCVAIWCWADYDRSAEKRGAAHHHLELLKGQFRAASRTPYRERDNSSRPAR